MGAPDTATPAVLLLHNRYREPGGEERSVAAMEQLLRERGHRVARMERSSDELSGAPGRLRAVAAMIAGGARPVEVRAAVETSGAAIVHAHNLLPLLGPRALAAARDAGARVVMHLHNYRLFCQVAISYLNGEPCMRCHGRNTLPGLVHRCRGGLAEPAVYATALSLHQRPMLEAVDRFVAPSHAAAERLVAFGMPADRLDVLHNFLPESEYERQTSAQDGRHALYAGRLAEEKGVDTAIEAARRSGVPLAIAGSGPDEERLRSVAGGAPVTFLGRLSGPDLRAARRAAAFAVLPSRWDEPCPYAAIEAMAAGLPVLASSAGGLPELVGEDSTLPRRGADAWAGAMSDLWQSPERRRERGEAALARARELFGPGRFYSGLMEIYTKAAGAVRAPTRP